MTSNTNFSEKRCYRPIGCPCPAPKKLLTSKTWVSRNDSSSINAVLHPENNFSPRLNYNEKTKGNVKEKHILSRNNCYCTVKGKTLPRPTLFKRPNSCINFEPLASSNGVENEDNLKRKSLTKCTCESGDNVGTDLELGKFSQTNNAKNLPVEESLEYTEQRKNYEQYRRVQDLKRREKLRRYVEDEKYQEGKELGAGDSENVDVLLDPQNIGTTATSLSNYGRTATSLLGRSNDDFPSENFPVYDEWSVPNFRREHYFETHHIGKLRETTGELAQDEHICIHQFRLNKKQLPEAVTTDTFGRSLCKLCGKPMEGSTLNLASTLFSGDRVSKSKMKHYADSYKSGFSPTTINLGRGKSRIELILSGSDLATFGSSICKNKTPIYCNSLALRHQRKRLV